MSDTVRAKIIQLRQELLDIAALGADIKLRLIAHEFAWERAKRRLQI
jgi:hypothetical protein